MQLGAINVGRISQTAWACCCNRLSRKMKTIVAVNSTEIIAKTRLGWPVFVAASWSHFDKVLFITIASENLNRERRANFEQARPALCRVADGDGLGRSYRAALRCWPVSC